MKGVFHFLRSLSLLYLSLQHSWYRKLFNILVQLPHLIDKPHALLWLANATLSPPVCMLARSGAHDSWIRAVTHCPSNSEFDSPLQTARMCFLKGVLGVKRTTPNWAVLRECGQEPLQLIGSMLLSSFFSYFVQEDCACRYCSRCFLQCWTVEFIEACESLHASNRYNRYVYQLR